MIFNDKYGTFHECAIRANAEVSGTPRRFPAGSDDARKRDRSSSVSGDSGRESLVKAKLTHVKSRVVDRIALSDLECC